VAWAAYCVASDSDQGAASWAIFVKNFGPAFFLLSWSTGQYFRVRKQSVVESRLSTIVEHLQGVTKTIVESTSELAATLSGGDSFCYASITAGEGPHFVPLLVFCHVGNYPLYDATARIVDLDKAYFALNEMQDVNQNFNLGNLIPNHATLIGPWPIDVLPKRRFNIFFTARNGSFSQMLRLVRKGDHWISASVVRRGEATLYEKVDESFPRNNDGRVDWT
jgi:hypothetical protein